MVLSYCSWSHSRELNAPQPQLPDVSDVTSRSGLSAFKGTGIEMPFYAAASWNHHSKSDWNSLFRHIRASICLWDEDKLIILQTNDCPGLVTVAACCSRALGDRSSPFVQPRQEAVVICSRQSLPSTVRVVAGPSDLSGSVRIPSSWKACKAEAIDDAHCVECGSPVRMKSSM